MNLLSRSGPIRLAIAVSVVWAVWAIAVALYGPIEPRLNAWINVKFVDPDEHRSLFERLDCWRLAVAILVPIGCTWGIGALGFWVRAGYAAKYPAPMLIPGRLSDVLALIQVLALDQHAHRSQKSLETEIQGLPQSPGDWASVAKSHPEFFRIDSNAENPISLVARHVSGTAGTARAPLSNEYTHSLLSLAVELHDRQLRRERTWEVFVPVVVAAVGGLIALVAQAAAR